MSYLRVCICILAAATLACSDSPKPKGTAGAGGFGGDGAGAGSAGVNSAGSGGSGSGGASGNGLGGAGGSSGTGSSGVSGSEDAGPDAETTPDSGTDTNDAAIFEDAGPEPDPDAGPDPDPDAGSGEPWPPAPGADLAGLPDAWATALCAALDDCLLPTYYEFVYDGPACKQTVLSQLADGDFVYLQASIDAERVTFDKTMLAACYTALTAQSCNVFSSRSPTECDAALHGVVPNGEPCVLDNDCVPGSFCDRSAACPGVCAALRAENGVCDRSEQCTSGRVCAESKCRTPAINGEQCDENGKPPCALGTLCLGADPDMNVAGTCMDQATAFGIDNGQVCDPSAGDLCKDGSACVIDLPDGSSNPNDLDAFCRPRVAAGAACNYSFGPTQCPTGQYCPTNLAGGSYEDTCEAAPGEGQACGIYNNCAPGLSCKADKKCHAPTRIGAACEVASDCASGRCRSDKCAAPARCRLDAVAPACGDDTCDDEEDCRNCAVDCGACPIVCGDDVCEGTETCSNCAADCNVCPPVCGDGTCNGTENCMTCAGDCGACPAPYSGPCTADASCGAGKKCVKNVNPVIPALTYGYCGANCSLATDCTNGGVNNNQRACNSGSCALTCNLLIPLCPLGMQCFNPASTGITGICTRPN